MKGERHSRSLIGPETEPVAEKEASQSMSKYQCSVCGYIYDPADGDEDGGIEPGTAFEDLPEDWECPVCGAPKSDFERID